MTAPTLPPTAAPAPLLEASNLCFAYDDTPAVDGVSLHLSAGEVVTLIGPNGSGKSTLIKLLLGLHQGKGTLRWENRPLKDWPLRERARRIAYLPQSPTADAEQTVMEVLRLGRLPYMGSFGLESDDDLATVRRISRLLDLDPFLTRRIAELSGGQRQRVFLGRCLVQEPVAMLLDEPHTYLDLRHQLELSNLLRRLAREQNLGVLMASHDLNLSAALSDRLILMDRGKTVLEGPPQTILDPAVLSTVYQLPLERVERPGMRPLVFPVIQADSR